jgi:hypothetical protein
MGDDRWTMGTLAPFVVITKMSSTYSAVAFISDESDFTIPAAADHLSSRPSLPGVHVEVISDDELHLLFDGWRLRIAISGASYVTEEAREKAEAHPNYEYVSEVALCKRMASIWSEDADPDMDHFNDYLLTVEALIDSFRGVYASDNASGDWF